MTWLPMWSLIPSFCPWCKRVVILSSEEDIVEVLLTLAKGKFTYQLATENHMNRNKSIGIELLGGPFATLHGLWTFKPIEDNACCVTLNLKFELSNPVLKAAIGSVFEQTVDDAMAAFVVRTGQLYGSGNE